MDERYIHNLRNAYYTVLFEGTADDVAERAQKLANQRKGQTPGRKSMYQNLAKQARRRTPKNPNDLLGASRFERSLVYGPQITPASSQRASEDPVLGGITYVRSPQRLPKSREKYRR